MSLAALKRNRSDSPTGARPIARPAAPATDRAGGVPLYLAPVQRKCSGCGGGDAADSEADERLLQRDAGGNGGAPTGGPTAQRIGSAGVAQADGPLPHAGRIQAAFGHHDLSGVRAQVGGPAARASQQLGARAFTMGRHIGFKSEPDLRLAAHEAAHVVQQRRGVQLKDGVGSADDPYEQQADAVAERVVAGQSAQDVLEGPSGGEPAAVQAQCACGGTCARCRALSQADEDEAASGALQMDLEVNATRRFEPPMALEDTPEAGAGAGGGPRTSVDAGAAEEGGTETPVETEGASDSADGATAGEPSAAPAADVAADAAPGGDAAAAETGAGTDAPEATSAPADPATASGGGGDGGTTTSTTGSGSGGSTTPTCFRRPREEPDPEPEEPAPNPEATQVEETTSDEGEEDLEAPDDCSAATDGAVAADAAAPTAEGETVGPEASAGVGTGADAAPVADGAGPAPAGGGGGGGGGAAEPAPAMSVGSPLEGVIAAGEGQRGDAVAAYAASRATLAQAGAGVGALRAGTGFAVQAGESLAEAAQRQAASERANGFFRSTADRLDAATALAGQQIPDQLGVAAESAKAQIASAMDTEKGSISARIEQARGQARTDAALARGAVRRQAASFIGQATAQTAAAIGTLRTAHREATGQVDTLETTTLDSVNEVYANGRTDLAALGTSIGGECTAKGAEFAATYRSFSHCTENGFWDGNLSQRRAAAQADAAESVATGYHDRLVEAARKRAMEATRDGRKADRCSVIATAAQTRSTLDQQLEGLVQALEAARDAVIAQAEHTRDGLLGAIGQGLRTTLQQFDQQEHDQLQLIDDTGYMQQVMQEQLAHAGAAALQQAVASAVGSTLASLAQVQARLAASAAPDPLQLDEALLQVQQRIHSALSGLDSSASGGASATEGRLAGALQQGLGALAAVTQGNDVQAQEVGGGFTTGMSTLAGTDNFAAQRSSFTQQVTQSTSAGAAALNQAVTGMTQGCEQTLAAAATALTQAHTDLETNLRQQRGGLEAEMTSKADEAAAQEAPAWKRVLAVVLVIIVVVIVIAVIIATGGGALAGLGPLAAIAAGAAIGAAVGAVTSGLLAIAGNLWSNRDWTEGVGTAILVGAVTGALGGGLGAAAGAGVGAVFNGARAGVQVAAQLGAALVTAGGMDVATQYVMGGFSFDHFSWGQLGFTMVLTVVTFGIGHRVGVRAAARAPTARAAAPPAAAPAEPTIGFGRTPAPRAAGSTPSSEPRIGFGRNPVGRPPGAGPAHEPTIGFGRTPAPRAAGSTPSPEPRIGFGRNPVGRPPGAGPAHEPTIGFGRTPAPRAAGSTPSPEPRIGFGRNPVGRPPGAGPAHEPTIGFGRTPAPRTPPAAGGTPLVGAPEPVMVGGPRPVARGGASGTVNETLAPRAMAASTEPRAGLAGDPVVAGPHEGPRMPAPAGETPAPLPRPVEPVAPEAPVIEPTVPEPPPAAATPAVDRNGNPIMKGGASAGPDGVVEHPVSSPEVIEGPRTGGAPEASAGPEPLVEPEVPASRPRSTSEEIHEVLEEVTTTTPDADQAETVAHADDVREQANPRTSESTSGPERARAAAEAEQRGPHPDDMAGNEAEIGSTVPDERPPGDLFDDPEGFVGAGGEPLRRPALSEDTRATIEANAERNAAGQFVDGDGNVINDPHFGHTHGHENRRILAAGQELGLTQQQVSEYVNARPEFFKIEEGSVNLSHADEMPGLEPFDHIVVDMERFFGL